jgi:hypothetical protein
MKHWMSYDMRWMSKWCIHSTTNFPSRVEEVAEAIIMFAGGHDRMGCFTDQVKLTRASV